MYPFILIEKDAEPMELMQAISTRRSVRAFENRPVALEDINAAIAAAQLAPSWKNTQTAGFIVVHTPEMMEKLKDALPSYNARIVSTAGAVVVMTARRGRCGYERDGSYTTRKEDRWEMFDNGLACQNLLLSAWERGLASCVMGIYDEEKLPALLDVAEDQYVTAVVALGYPAETPNMPKRKPLEEKVRYV